MENWKKVLDNFILQSKTNDLKTLQYPKEFGDLKMRISFGMGAPARVPWISFLAPEMATSNGIYPVYLYYKDLDTLILGYGVSETETSLQTWPPEIINSSTTISAFFDKKVPRYGDSFVFKSYKIKTNENQVTYLYDNHHQASGIDLESDLNTIVDYYKKVLSLPSNIPIINEIGQGLFYMEKELENFIIFNWDSTELGKKYDLLYEDGEMVSQQYRTDIGPIDILAKEKNTNSYVVIELKRNQTSDDTVGQLARYMGWIKDKKKDQNVKGIIIAGDYDRKLDYARNTIPNIDVFIYEVDFKLKEFRN